MINLWIEENMNDQLKYGYAVKNTLFSGESEFQKVDVVETYALGKMLFNDNLAMISEKDEFVYHDMISHVPLFTHPNPKKVLVIGGGDGGTLREVIRHESVEKCVMVEIDKLVVDACREHIPQTSFALDDPKAELIIDDGVKYVAETTEKFDVIIVDSTDPIGPATPLFGEEFYANVHRILNDNGIVVAQAESPYLNHDMQKTMMKNLSKSFSVRLMYNYTNLTYPGGMWTFAYASKGLCPVSDFDKSRVKNSGMEFQYYNSNIHKGSFMLPSFQLNNVKEFLTELPEL